MRLTIIGPLRTGRISLLMAGTSADAGFEWSFVAQRGGFGGPSGAGNISRGGIPRAPFRFSLLLSPTSITVLLTVNVTGQQNNSVAGISRDRVSSFEDGSLSNSHLFLGGFRPMTVGFISMTARRWEQTNKNYVLKDGGTQFPKEQRSSR
jgi:hypothetical protein